MTEKNDANIFLKDTPELNILSAMGMQNFSSPLAQSMLQSLINCTNILFIITDNKGIIQLFSPGAEIILGYKADEVIKNKSISDLCDHRDLIERTTELNVALNTKIKPGFETIIFHYAKGIEDYCALKFINKKGHDIQIQATITPLFDKLGNHPGYIITGTKNHFSLHDESIQKAINKKLISYIENAPSGVFIVDSSGRNIQTNKASCEVTGYSKEELSVMSLNELFHPKDKAKLAVTFQNLLEGGHTVLELYLITKQGLKKYLRINATKINTDSYMWVINDITDLKKAEKDLRRAKLVAEAKNRAKSNFIANMSHEIKNPLNAIIGFSEILLSSIQDVKQLSQITAINKSGKNLLKILNDILDLSKIEANKIVLEPIPVNLNTMFSDIELIFGQKIIEKGLSFSIEKDADITYKHILDETRLRQILFNLIGNAIKFTEKGSISLAYHSVFKSGNKVDLTILIQDTGIGIPRDQQRLIFEQFHQQDHQNVKKFGGTGLGLSISKRLTELMGGELIVISDPGKGSIFKVVIPGVEIQSAEKQEEVNLSDEFTFDQVTELTDEQKLHLPEVIRVLENEFLPLNESVIQKQLIENIEMFGQGLIAFGEANVFQIITNYGKKICQYVDSFEIDNIMKTLKAFPDLIQKIKSLNFSKLLILQAFFFNFIDYQFNI